MLLKDCNDPRLLRMYAENLREENSNLRDKVSTAIGYMDSFNRQINHLHTILKAVMTENQCEKTCHYCDNFSLVSRKCRLQICSPSVDGYLRNLERLSKDKHTIVCVKECLSDYPEITAMLANGNLRLVTFQMEDEQ